MKRKKRILVAPLDWGIGHATRCIPVITKLLEHNFNVIIGADKRPMDLLKKEFPQLEFITFPGYNITYPDSNNMTITIARQIPKILSAIKKENTQLKHIIEKHELDGVISDNRFGVWNDDIPCVFITHQLEIQSKILKSNIQKINYSYINKYNACWIPDYKINSLAENLSHPKKLPNNTHYIGPLSRFEKKEVSKKYKLIGIVSGPEPQRTHFEDILKKALLAYNKSSLLILGKPESKTKEIINKLTILSHIDSKSLNTAMLKSEIVVSRPGYSTIMDLDQLGKKAIFIPTEGQTEQEYLADRLFKKKICYIQKQSEFNLPLAIKNSKKYTGFIASKKQETDWGKLFSLF